MNEQKGNIAKLNGNGEMEAQLRSKFPLHFAVFENNLQKLMAELESDKSKECLNSLDVHGRTPLMLATMLGHLECAEILLEKGADTNIQNREMWSLSHEAIPWKNHNFLKKVLTYRDYQRAIHTSNILLELNKSLKNTSDFSVEMNWEFTSWLPFVKNMCPSDTYKIYKSGSNIRIDANMLEIGAGTKNGSSAQSFIFRFSSDKNAEIAIIDPDQRIAYVSIMDLETEPKIEDFVPSDCLVAEKFRSPITTTYVDVDNVGFERSAKSGFLSWIGSNEKEEEVEGYTCRVMNASNVEIMTKTRLDHLSREEREEAERNISSNKTLSLVMGLFEKKRVNDTRRDSSHSMENDADVYGGQTAISYLAKQSNKPIGKRREEQIKSNSFKANLWLSETFPLNLREQIFPIIDLMAVRNAKFSRLKSFIELQLPSGFPIRIRIPMFHLINAQVTFRNVNDPGHATQDNSANELSGSDFSQQFRLHPSLFQIPEDFEMRELAGSLLFNRFEDANVAHSSADSSFNSVDVEDEYVYLLERFGRTDETSPQSSNSYEQQVQHAIEESLAISSNRNNSLKQSSGESFGGDQQQNDPELHRILQVSKEEEERRRQELEVEEEEMRKAIELSLIEK